MKDFLAELFNYHHHYNQLLIEQMVNETVSDEAIRQMSHIINAQDIWNARLDGSAHRFSVWQIHPVTQLGALDQGNRRLSLQLLNRLPLDQEYSYHTLSGKAFSNSIRDTLFHIAHHGTYHRAQIALEFRAHGPAPIPSDFIHYKRTLNLKA